MFIFIARRTRVSLRSLRYEHLFVVVLKADIQFVAVGPVNPTVGVMDVVVLLVVIAKANVESTQVGVLTHELHGTE